MRSILLRRYFIIFQLASSDSVVSVEIQLSHVSHCFAQGLRLEDINVTVPSGSTLAICGRSGSGKSLLFSIVSGIFAPQQGQVLANNVPVYQMDKTQNLAFRRELGVVFQICALISNLTLRENMMLPLNLYFPENTMAMKHQQVEGICHEFGLEAYLDARTDELSTGQACLAGLARALMLEPKCLIWDAPLCEIDLTWSEHIFRRLKHLKRAGATLLLFTNRERLIDEFADQVLELRSEQHHQEDCLVYCRGELRDAKLRGKDHSALGVSHAS